jgi:hypothetical protein
MANSMKVAIKPDWDEIEAVRGKAGQFLEQHGLPANVTKCMVMVLSELVENSIKYGSFPDPDSNVDINLEIGTRMITAEVSNAVDETCLEHLQNLDRMIQWVRGYQDPFEAYVERLEEVSKKPLHDEESGLGIVRIAYEGKVLLDFFVNEDNLLTVSAVRNLK